MIVYRKSFNFTASDEELYNYVDDMINIIMGDLDTKVDYDFESDAYHRYVNFRILNKALN